MNHRADMRWPSLDVLAAELRHVLIGSVALPDDATTLPFLRDND
jgi:hypothetical protein